MDTSDLAADPIEQLSAWLADAAAANLVDPHAMVLSTAGADGRPRGRHVLLKGLDDIAQSLQHAAEIDAHEESHAAAATMFESVDVKNYGT